MKYLLIGILFLCLSCCTEEVPKEYCFEFTVVTTTEISSMNYKQSVVYNSTMCGITEERAAEICERSYSDSYTNGAHTTVVCTAKKVTKI